MIFNLKYIILKEVEFIFYFFILFIYIFYFIASSTATATATEAPTIGLFPIPINPIISTCAGTEELPANCASECILPIVSVIPYEAGPAAILSGCNVLPVPPPLATEKYFLPASILSFLYVCIIHLLLKDCAACIRASRIPELLSVLFHLLLLSRKCAIV